ncbi:MAG TPA: AI-2E family transporter [Anaerolineales bacterium]
MAILITLMALGFLWLFRTAVVYVLISLFLAAALRPLVNRLVGRRFMVRMAWILFYLVAFVSFGFLLFQAGKIAINEIQLLAQTVSVQDAWRLPSWLDGSLIQKSLVTLLPPPSQLFLAITGSKGQLVLPAVLGFTQSMGDIVSGVLVILFLSIYWSINQIHFERLWLSLLPSGQRKQVRDIWRIVEPDLGAYIRSEVVQSLLAGLLLGLVYWLSGSPYPILLAVTGAIFWLVPVMGAPLALILPLLMGLLTSVPLSLSSALYTLVVLIALEVWVEPRLFRRKWDNPILTLVIILAMADAFGFVGIIIAPPLSAVCQILWNLVISHRVLAGAAIRVSDLKERQARLWDTIKAMDGPPVAIVASSMENLTHLIEKAEPILQAALPVESSEPFHLSQPVTAEGGSSGSTYSEVTDNDRTQNG